MLICGCLFACQTELPFSGESTSGEGNVTEEPNIPKEPIPLIQNGTTQYQIVIPRSAGSAIKTAADRLVESFGNFDVEISVVDDGGNRNQNVPTDTCEILLGKTNRAESKAVDLEESTERGYYYFVSNHRIGIVASDEFILEMMVYQAIEQMEATYQNGVLALPEATQKTVDFNSGNTVGWFLYGVPIYQTKSTACPKQAADCGPALRDNFRDSSKNSKMQIISNTSLSEYRAYLALLESNGYQKQFENSIGDNQYAQYSTEYISLYVYYTAAIQRVNIIMDRSESTPVDEFGYSYTPKAGDESVLYEYGLKRDVPTKYGTLEVIKLADNSLFIIDGGAPEMFDQTAIDGFADFAKHITGVKDGEKIRISCWYMTHPHGDHYEVLLKVILTSQYSSLFTLERVAFNLPSADILEVPTTLMHQILTYYPNVKSIKLHTGMTFQIANMKVEVLHTHEDMFKSTGETAIAYNNTNATSGVLKLTLGGVRFLSLGDIEGEGERVFVKNIPASVIRSDVVQVAHHCINNVSKIYDRAMAPYAVFPQSKFILELTQKDVPDIRQVLNSYNSVKKYANEENCFFGDHTTGLLFKDGTVSVKEELPLVFGDSN